MMVGMAASDFAIEFRRLDAQIGRAMRADRFRLRKRLRAIKKMAGDGKPFDRHLAQLGEAIGPLYLFAIEVLSRVEILDFGREAYGLIGRIEKRNGGSAALPSQQSLPVAGNVVTYRRDQAATRDDDPSSVSYHPVAKPLPSPRDT